jgi:hypothetical protein
MYTNPAKPWKDMNHYRRSVSDASVLFAGLTVDGGHQYLLRYVADPDQAPVIRGFVIQVMTLDTAKTFGVAGPDTVITGLYGMADICGRIVDGRRRHVMDDKFMVTVGPDYRDLSQLAYYGSTPVLNSVFWAGDNINRYGDYQKRDGLDLTRPIKISLLGRFGR